MTAPVQVLVVGFDDATYSGEVLAELARLREAGLVRLVDLLLVRKDADGLLETLAAPDAALAGFGDVAARFLSADGEDRPVAPEPGTDPDGEASWWSVADAIPPGGNAVVALLEHLWAAPLAAAIEARGGRALDEAWLGPDDRVRLERAEATQVAPGRPAATGSRDGS